MGASWQDHLELWEGRVGSPVAASISAEATMELRKLRCPPAERSKAACRRAGAGALRVHRRCAVSSRRCRLADAEHLQAALRPTTAFMVRCCSSLVTDRRLTERRRHRMPKAIQLLCRICCTKHDEALERDPHGWVRRAKCHKCRSSYRPADKTPSTMCWL